ncbi:hypothetical protein ABXN37_01885 [Piscinibacter sakaiensis]|uniref:DUF58 domain-containing protein n=1 Tax=Piscinibacter sakaiensis TaxID=1547922 RepID=UPI0037277DB8
MATPSASSAPTSGRDALGLLEAAAVLGRRGLVFLVSDFHLPLAQVERLLDGLAVHELVPVLLWEPDEFDLGPRAGLARLRDPETGERRLVWWRPALRARWHVSPAVASAAAPAPPPSPSPSPPVGAAAASVSSAGLDLLETEEPRAFGYHVGDRVERRFRLRVPAPWRLDPDSLPGTGRRGRSLELREARWDPPGPFDGDVHRLTLRYQVFAAPPQVQVLELPPVRLRFDAAGREHTLRLDAWPLAVGPLAPPANARPAARCMPR